MKKILVYMAIASATLSAQGQAGGGVDKQIIALEQKWAQLQKANDTNGVAPLLADNFVIVFADGRVMNKAQTLEDGKKNKMSSVEASDLKVNGYGNTAVVTGIWDAKGTDANGKPLNEHERFVDTWRKGADGRWQCIASGNAYIK